MRITIAVLISLVAVLPTNTASAASNNLRTEADYHIGLSLSSYKYQEPGYMSLKGAKFGLDIQATDAWSNGYFISGDFRYAFGTVDYQSKSTGNSNGDPDWYIEVKEVIGKDWGTGESLFSPYTGLGYRYLNHDGRGLTSTGAAGYRRESHYLYLPVGVVHQTKLKHRSKLMSTLEYDYLLIGRQISRLSDTGFLQDVTNQQSRGYGLKLSVILENSNWAIGPYANYWNIDQSDIEIIYLSNGTPIGTGAEPKNDTVEFGIKASQRF